MPPGIAVMMDRMRSALMALRIDRSGATAIEYALIAGLISITILIWAICDRHLGERIFPDDGHQPLKSPCPAPVHWRVVGAS